jgi:hypothetical protein
MANPNNYGYWTFNNGTKNALYGAASTREVLPDGRVVIVKDPQYPAVLEDEFIIYALKRSLIARRDFNRLYPTMDAVSQNRLQNLIVNNPQVQWVVTDPTDDGDRIQRNEVTKGIHLNVPRPAR